MPALHHGVARTRYEFELPNDAALLILNVPSG